MFSGLFVGHALVSFAADRFGRRTIFTYSLLWYTVASVIMAFQHDAFGLNLWRFISGIGVGVELVTIDTYLSELVPANLRGPRVRRSISPSNFAPCLWWRSLAWLLVPRASTSDSTAGAGWCCSGAVRGNLRVVDPPAGSRKSSLDCPTHKRRAPSRQLF